MDRTRNREHVFTLFICHARSDERTAGQRGFDYETPAREAADQSIAPREVGRYRRRSQWKLRNDATGARELMRELTIASGIDDVKPCANDGNAARERGEAAAVRGGVNAESEPAHNGQPRFGQRAREGFGVSDA